MDLVGQVALFRLTPAGRKELRDLVPAKASFAAVILGTDGTGAWILPRLQSRDSEISRASLMLLKWNYVATVHVDYAGDVGIDRKPIGFR